MTCPTCGGSGWMCEDHPDRPHPHADCGAVGVPCPDCNADEPPRLPDGWISIASVAPPTDNAGEPGFALNCPICGAVADYVRIDAGPTYVFTCSRHGRLILPPDGRVRQQPA